MGRRRTEQDMSPTDRLEYDQVMLEVLHRTGWPLKHTLCPAPRIPVARGNIECPVCGRIYPTPDGVLPPHLRTTP